jgi:2-polyprenyl-3-methyl-5-hydroxy-6-metoxy-1,4-benzoquinol methylase
MTSVRPSETEATALAPELRAELQGAGWMYAWPLTPTITTPVLAANLEPVHRTRAEMIEPLVRQALVAAGPDARALDLACNEGWFSHQLLGWGAGEVVGIDVREHNIYRAELLREHFGLSPERLSFRCADVFDLDPEQLGQFDVVLMLGLIYHLERPLEAIRIARRVTRGVCVIESQLTRQQRPIVYGQGSPNAYLQTSVSFAAWSEDTPESPLASTSGVMSLVPNRAALETMPQWAGFRSVEFLSAEPDHDRQYLDGDRAVVVASVRESRDGPLTGLALPPPKLRVRVGTPDDSDDPALHYEETGLEWRELITARLPADWDWAGKRMLDFGCGAGRLLRWLVAEAEHAEIWGCDIDSPSIEWMSRHLVPPFHVQTVAETPGLAQPDGYFDLVSAASVFTHITDHWAGWLLELHRLLRDDGLLIASYLGPQMGGLHLPVPWDEDRTGMLTVNRGAPWQLGGPTVFHSTWWLRAHWGRAFEFVAIEPEACEHGLMTLRKRPVELSIEDLQRPEPGEPRETEALRHQIEVLHTYDQLRWQNG